MQFPQAGIDDPSGLWLKRYALDGLHYAVACAGKNTTKIVANLSWGPQTGPHDGTSILETEIETLISEQKALPKSRDLIVSLPAGNSFDARAHARIDYANGGQVAWFVPPDGETPAFIELWWPRVVPVGEACLRITPPYGPAVNISPGKNVATDKTWWVMLKAVGPSVRALLVVHPTGGFAKRAKGQHGRWQIEIDATPSGTDGDVHVYVRTRRSQHERPPASEGELPVRCRPGGGALRCPGPSLRRRERLGGPTNGHAQRHRDRQEHAHRCGLCMASPGKRALLVFRANTRHCGQTRLCMHD